MDKHAITYNVTGIDNPEGLVSGATSVKTGESVDFTVADVYGYTVQVSANNSPLTGDNGVYTLNNVTSDTTVNVEYTANTTYDFTVPDSVRNSDNAHGMMGASTLPNRSDISVGNDLQFEIKTWIGAEGSSVTGYYWLLNSLEINNQTISLPRSYTEGASATTTLNNGVVVRIELTNINELTERTGHWPFYETHYAYEYTYEVSVTGAKDDVEMTFINFVGSNHHEVMPHFDSNAVVVTYGGSQQGTAQNEKPIQTTGGAVNFYLDVQPGYELTSVTLDGAPVQPGYNGAYTVSNTETTAKHLDISTQPIAYSVHYDMNGVAGTAPTDETRYGLALEKNLVVAGAPETDSGKVFLGWKLGDVTYQPGTVLNIENILEAADDNSRTITFTAQWGDRIEEGQPITVNVDVYLQNENGQYVKSNELSKTELAYGGDTVAVRDPESYLGGKTGYTLNDEETDDYLVLDGTDTTLELYFDLPAIELTANNGGGVYNNEAYMLNGVTAIAGGSAAGVTIEYRVGEGEWTDEAPSATDVADSLTGISVRVTKTGYETVQIDGLSITVTQKPVTVTANSASKLFGQGDPEFTATVDGTLNGDEVAYTVTRPNAGTDEAVGTYPGTVVASGEESQGNYKVTFANGDFTINTNNVDLGLTAESGGGVYTSDPYYLNNVAATGSAADGATIEYKWGEGEWTDEAPSATDVADSLTGISVRVTKTGYETVQIDGLSITVTQRPALLDGYTFEPDRPYTGETYSSTDFTVESESEGRGLLADHTLSGVTYSISGTAVGEYTGEFTGTPVVTAGEDATDLSSNYSFSYDEGTLNIVASPIADYVTLDTTDVVQTYDGTAHAAGTATATDANGNDVVVEYSVNGTDWTTDPSTIAAAEVADSVTVQVRASVPGTYTGYVTGIQQLTINPRPVTITVADASKVFGDADPTFSPADMAGQVEGELTDVDLSVHRTNADEAAAVYENVLTINPTDAELEADYGNYDFSIHNGDFTITAQSITPGPDPENPDPTYREVTVDYPQDVSYNGVDQTWVPTVTDAEDNLLTVGEDYEVSYSTDDRTNVTGTITVTITGKGNYSGTITREYQITPLKIDVYIESQTKVEGEADPTFTFNYEGVLEGESMGWTGAFVRDAGEAAGTYNVAQGGFVLADNEAGNFLASNYTLTVHPGTLTITAAPVPPGPDGPDTPVTPVTPLPTPDPTPVPTPTPGDPGATETTTTPETEEATATIEDDATPRTAPEPIDDDATPLAASEHRDCWVHWLMLLGILVTVVYYGGVGVRRVRFSSSLQSFEDDVLGNDETNR